MNQLNSILPDYHIHTPFCKHAEGELVEFLEAARRKNLPEICFTDHAPNPDNYDPKHRMSVDEFKLYEEQVLLLSSRLHYDSTCVVRPSQPGALLRRSRPKATSGSSGALRQGESAQQVTLRQVAEKNGEMTRHSLPVADDGGPDAPSILFGVEADYYNGCERFLRKWLLRHKFDLVIGSIHYINNWGFDNPDEREVWDNVDVGDTWEKYFELVGRLADTHLFDVVGHFDLPKKFGYFPGEHAIKGMVKPVLDKVARAKMAIEINTSGLRRPVREIYPSILLLKMARDHGIPICFGSDAHKPDEVGYEFAPALEWARKAGYSEAVRFSARHKKSYALPVK